MDVGELLNYKPPQSVKRTIEPDAGSDEEDGLKQRKIRRAARSPPRQATADTAVPDLRALDDISEQERQEILKYVETEETHGEAVDETTVKRMVLVLEKRALRNREMRIKFPDSPEKFMESEAELHESLQEMRIIATAPDLYPLLVQLRTIPSLLELLSHENTDMAVAVVALLQELTDVDVLHESTEGADALVDALLEQQVCSLLVQNLERLDETVKEESEGVHDTLAIVENLAELRPQVRTDAARQGLMQWLLKRLRLRAPFDANKLYASEMLSILLQDNEQNRIYLGELDGIDTLLQQLAVYKRNDPMTAEEREMMENLFDCLCGALMVPINRERFLRGEGLQLMNLMLREKKMSRGGSLRVLDHAMSGPHGRDNCNKFVDILGLRTVFPLFMKTPRRHRKRLLSAEEHEEHVTSIVSSMLRNCRGPQRQRLIAKFTENDHEKVDRLLELHFKYLEKVEAIDAELGDDDDSDEENEDRKYLTRLDGGLFTLQLVDYIILEVCAAGPASIKQRVSQILALRGASMKTIRHVMREYAGNLGDEGDSDWREQEQQHILQLVDKF